MSDRTAGMTPEELERYREPSWKRWQRECPDCQEAMERGHRLCLGHEDGMEME